jgi:hypothetical protein
MVVGSDELRSGTLKLKELASGTEMSGSLQDLLAKIGEPTYHRDSGFKRLATKLFGR